MKRLNHEQLAELARTKFEESADLAREFIDQNANFIAELVQLLVKRFSSGHKLFLFGNGGSAADAQHIAAEFVNRLSMEHPALPAIALTTDTSVLTSIANDRSFAEVFSRQLEALGQEGDVVWGISTSGTSENVLRAFSVAGAKNLTTVFSAGEGGKHADVDFLFAAPHRYSARIQEVHIILAHTVCELVELIMFGGENV